MNTAKEQVKRVAAANNWAEEATSAYSILTRDGWRMVVDWSRLGTVTRVVMGERRRARDGTEYWEMHTRLQAPNRKQKAIDILTEPRTGEKK